MVSQKSKIKKKEGKNQKKERNQVYYSSQDVNY